MDLVKVHEVIDVERRKQMISLDQLNGITEEEQFLLHDKIADTKEIESQNLKEMRMLLTNAISKLKPEQVKLIELHYFEDVSQKQIAEILDVSSMQVSRMLKRALRSLFRIIQAQENND